MKKNEIYESGDVREFLRMLLSSHSGRGAYNVIMAKANSVLREKIVELTSFLNSNEFDFINMQTRIYMIAHDMALADFPFNCIYASCQMECRLQDVEKNRNML